MSYYYYVPHACPQTQKSHFPRITSPRDDFIISVPFLQNHLYPHLVADSCLYSETFKKSFPDGVTGNHYFFLRSINAQHFPSNGKHLLYRAWDIFRTEENWSLSLILLNSIFHSEPQNRMWASDVKSNLGLTAETKNNSRLVLWLCFSLVLVYQYCT